MEHEGRDAFHEGWIEGEEELQMKVGSNWSGNKVTKKRISLLLVRLERGKE